MVNQTLIPDLYCLPGLGADRRLFSGFNTNLASVHYIDYFDPADNESFSQYAFRLSQFIDENRPFYLMGISLGGLFATEIAKWKNPKGIIYLSTIKSADEKSTLIRLGKHLPFPGFGMFKKTVPLARMYFKSDEDFDLFNLMLKDTSEKFGNWATEQVVQWNQTQPEVPFLHINGDKDELFPPSKIKDVKVVPGRHDLTLYGWPVLNPIINEWLKNQQKA